MPFYPVEEKKERLLAMLEEGLVALHLDARHPDIEVPDAFKSDPQLVLNLSYRFLLDDLVIDDTGVKATLSFGGVPFFCVLPFEALWGLSQPKTENELDLFPDSLPLEMLMRFLPHLPPEIYEQAENFLRPEPPKEPDPNSELLPFEEGNNSKPLGMYVPAPEDATDNSEPETSTTTSSPSRPSLRLVSDSSDSLPATSSRPRPSRSHLRLVKDDE